jgi:hypothetical protein
MGTAREVSDRLSDVHFELKKVEGTFGTLLSVGSEESPLSPSSEDVLAMMQLLSDIVTPACSEIDAIIQSLDAGVHALKADDPPLEGRSKKRARGYPDLPRRRPGTSIQKKGR